MARSHRLTATALLLPLALASCGLGDKQAAADGIIDAVDRTFAAGTATGTLTSSLALVSEGEVPVGPPRQPRPPAVVEVALDLRNGVASGQFRSTTTPYAVFDDKDLYARKFNAAPRDARPWVRVQGTFLREDDGGLAAREVDPSLAAFALNPIMLVDLAAAPLAGSITKLGPETVAGVETQRFKANFDLEKMLRDTREDEYPEERRDVVETLLGLLVVKGNTHPGEVWIDSEGLVRRFSVTLRQSPFGEVRFGLTLTLELPVIGQPVTVAVPGPREIVAAGTVRQFLNAAVPASDSEDYARVVLGLTPGAAGATIPRGPDA